MQQTKRPTPLRESPFAFTRPARQRGWFDRVLKRPRADLAFDALQHLLAQRDPTSLSDSDISAVLLAYDVEGAEARAVLVRMWRLVLGVFLADDSFSDREIAYLAALRSAFGLTEEEVRESERHVVHPRYAVALQDVLADARVTDAERATLRRLAAQLRVPDPVQRDLFERSSRATINELLQRSVADRRLSPDELDELASVARHLGITPDFGHATEAMLDRYAHYWRIENGDMPSVAADVPLEGDETCHLVLFAERHEALPALESIDREGIVSVRIARGVYYRAGSASTEPLNRSTLRPADRGRMLITSKRVLFEGDEGSVTVRHRDIVSFQVYADAIVLERRAGVGPWFTIAGDTEMAAVVLGAALARA